MLFAAEESTGLVVTNIIVSFFTLLVTGYFGWKGNQDKLKFDAKLITLENEKNNLLAEKEVMKKEREEDRAECQKQREADTQRIEWLQKRLDEVTKWLARKGVKEFPELGMFTDELPDVLPEIK